MIIDPQQAFAQEIKDLISDNRRVTLELDVPTAWILLSQLQLALRHPQNTGPSSRVARETADRIAAQVAVTPATRALYEAGFDPQCDV